MSLRAVSRSAMRRLLMSIAIALVLAAALSADEPSTPACVSLLSTTVTEALERLATEIGNGVLMSEAESARELRDSVTAAADQLKSDTQIILVNLWHCQENSHPGVKSQTCSGRQNIVNTGLSNYEPDDEGRDLVRWHGVSRFESTRTARPRVQPGEGEEGVVRRTYLQCWSVVP